MQTNVDISTFDTNAGGSIPPCSTIHHNTVEYIEISTFYGVFLFFAVLE